MANTILVNVGDLVFSSAQASGNNVTLAGSDLWDDPQFSTLAPVSAHTSINTGSLFDLSTSGYYQNIRQSGYYVDSNGVLNGFSSSMGAAYNTVTFASVLTNDTITCNGIVFTAVAGTPLDRQFQVGISDSITCSNFITAFNSTNNPGIKGLFQAELDVLGSTNIGYIEVLSPGASGNAYPLASNSNTRLVVAGGTFSGGADNATPTNPLILIERSFTVPAIAPGIGVTLSFTISGVNVTPLAGAEAFATFILGTGTVNQPIFPLTNGVFTSSVYMTTENPSTTEITVGITVENYVGQWQFSNFHVLLSTPTSYSTAGQFITDINLSSSANPPPGDPGSGIGGSTKRLMMLFGPGAQITELAKAQAGDTAIVDIGSPNVPASVNQTNIISAALAQGLKVFGYIPFGRDANASGLLPYPQDQLITMLTRCKNLGITGAYFDICKASAPWPSGFGVSRWRQNFAYLQSLILNLKTLWNDTTIISNTVMNNGLADLDRTTADMNGPGTIMCSGTTVTGTSTTFTTSMPSSTANWFVNVAGQTRQVLSIASDSSLTVTVAFSPTISSASSYTITNAVQHVINDGTQINIGTGHGILAESWGLTGNGTAEDWGTFQATGAELNVSRNLYGPDLFAIFYKLSGTTVLNVATEQAFAFYASTLYNLTGYALFDLLNLNDVTRPQTFLGTFYIDSQPIQSKSGNKLSRKTDQGVITISQDLTKANTNPLCRTGNVFQNFKAVTVLNIMATETIPSNTSLLWAYQTSSDGVVYSSFNNLADVSGTITDFPSPDQPNYMRLFGTLQTTNTAVSPTITFPITLNVLYQGSSYARVWGIIEPSVITETISNVNIYYTRTGLNNILIGNIAFSPTSENIEVAVDKSTGIWSINLAASVSGTGYIITVGSGANSYSTLVNLVAGGNYRI